MKKKFTVICGAAMILCSGCTQSNSTEQQSEIPKDTPFYDLKDITINGETHQFLIKKSGRGGMAHWPGCSYCGLDSLQNPEGNPD